MIKSDKIKSTAYFSSSVKTLDYMILFKMTPGGNAVTEREWRNMNLEWERRRRDAKEEEQRRRAREQEERRHRMELR